MRWKAEMEWRARRRNGRRGESRWQQRVQGQCGWCFGRLAEPSQSRTAVEEAEVVEESCWSE